MTRIATTSAQQSALADIMRAQRELNEAQRQYSTGRKADDLKGLAADSQVIAATRSVMAREASYVEAGKRLEARLDAQALAIGELSDLTAEMRQSVTEALGLDDGRTLISRLEGIVARASSALNTKFGGTYLFGGGKDSEPPFSGETLADLAAAPAATDLFNNGDIRSVARLSDGLSSETGMLADELGADLVAGLKRIKDFADSLGGSFNDPLSAAEKSFLTGEIQTISATFDRITELEAGNGLMQQRLEASMGQSQARTETLRGMLSDMEDADMAKVATRLQQTQLALQASAQAFSMLSRTSLLDFLR